MVEWCWENFQCWDVLLIWIIVGKGPIALTIDVVGVVWTLFSYLFFSSPLFSLGDGPNRPKYCLKGHPKPTNQTGVQNESCRVASPSELIHLGRNIGEGLTCKIHNGAFLQALTMEIFIECHSPINATVKQLCNLNNILSLVKNDNFGHTVIVNALSALHRGFLG